MAELMTYRRVTNPIDAKVDAEVDGKVAGPVEVRVARGSAAVTALSEHAAWVDERSQEFSTSSAWLLAAADHLPGEPVVITIARDGRVSGMATLTRRKRWGVTCISLLAAEYNDYAEFHLEDPADAPILAEAIIRWVRSHRRWSLSLGQLSVDDPVLTAIGVILDRSVIVPGPPMPRITGIGTSYRVSSDRRRNINNAINRATTDGHVAKTVIVADPATVDRWLDGIVEVRRGRDHGLGRRSHLDEPEVESFYRAVVRSFVRARRAVVYLLLVDEAIAGYSIVMVEGGCHRVFDGRVAHHLQRYKGGVVTDILAACAAADDDEISTFDWLRGASPAKFGNDVAYRSGLTATSHRVIARLEAAAARGRRLVKAALPDRIRKRLLDR